MEFNGERQLKKYQSYKNYIKFLNMSFGAWPNDQGKSPMFQYSMRLLTMLSSAFVTFCLIMYDFTGEVSIKRFTRGLGLLIGFFSIFMKICILAKLQKHLRFLNKTITASFEQDSKDPDVQKHALKHFPFFSRLCYFFTGMSGFTFFVITITPLYFCYKKGIYIRMYPQWLPFNIDPGSTRYWLMYVVEAYYSFMGWVVTGGADGLFGYYSLHVIGELNVLTEYFRRLKYSQNYEKDIKKCIERHVVIYKSIKILEKIYGFLSVWLAITCAISLCTIIFQVSQMQKISLFRRCYLTTHVVVKFSQAFTYAWNGEIIKAESENCLQAIYESHWPVSGKKQMMKDVIIVLSQKPLIFCGMHVMNLGLEMFSKVVNASISYYFILETLEEKEGQH